MRLEFTAVPYLVIGADGLLADPHHRVQGLGSVLVEGLVGHPGRQAPRMARFALQDVVIEVLDGELVVQAASQGPGHTAARVTRRHRLIAEPIRADVLRATLRDNASQTRRSPEARET